MSQLLRYVVLKDGERIEGSLVCARPRHTVLALQNGLIAKIVTGSHQLAQDPHPYSRASLRLRRILVHNRHVWRYLRTKVHPGLMRVYDRVVDQQGDEGFLCESLERYDTEVDNPFAGTLERFLVSGIRLCESAAVLHGDGKIHGDITPSNICLRDGLPVLIDMEMAVKAGQTLPDEERTIDGFTCCTPACCSPEQASHLPVHFSTDVYGIALTMLSWATGIFGVTHAHTDQSIADSLTLCARAQYPHWDLARSRIASRSTLQVLTRALQECPFDRYPNARAMSDALRELHQKLPRNVLNHRVRDTTQPELRPLQPKVERLTYDIG